MVQRVQEPPYWNLEHSMGLFWDASSLELHVRALDVRSPQMEIENPLKIPRETCSRISYSYSRPD